MSGKESKTESFIKQLRAQGHRMTAARKAILSILEASPGPISAGQLGEKLHKERDIEVNKTTVYRELEFLRDAGIVFELDLLDGKKRYELHAVGTSGHGQHHHHLVCTKCSTVRCVEVPGDLESIERKLQKEYGFSISHHVLEFFGLCGDCQPLHQIGKRG